MSFTILFKRLRESYLDIMLRKYKSHIQAIRHNFFLTKMLGPEYPLSANNMN
jgi:hypothetical protein